MLEGTGHIQNFWAVTSDPWYLGYMTLISIIDGNFLHPIKLIMIPQYKRIRVFRSSSPLDSVHVRAGP
jgi:hypothetical protein